MSSRRLVRACTPAHDGQSAARGAERRLLGPCGPARLQCLQVLPARGVVMPARRARAGGPLPRERDAGCSAAGAGSPHAAWTAEADVVVENALAGFRALHGESSALGVALVRGGAMGAAARLAQRYAHARGPREREDRAARAVSWIGALPRAGELPSPEVSARAGPPCCRAPQVYRAAVLACASDAGVAPCAVRAAPPANRHARARAGAAWAPRGRGRSGVRRGALGATDARGGPAGGHGGACGDL